MLYYFIIDSIDRVKVIVTKKKVIVREENYRSIFSGNKAISFNNQQ